MAEQGNALGFSLRVILTLIFMTLRLTGCIGWSWWWVLSPLWIPVAAWIALLLIISIIRIIQIISG